MEKMHDINILRERAQEAAKQAYCSYSKYPVAAVVQTKDGGIYKGCNVENASYGLSICAERNAIFQAVAAGQRQVQTLVLYAPTEEVYTPCGACRQVWSEFGQDARVYCCPKGDRMKEYTIKELFPNSFAL